MSDPTAFDPARSESLAAESLPWLAALRADPDAERAGVRWQTAAREAAAGAAAASSLAASDSSAWRVGEVILGADRPPAQLFWRPASPHELFAKLDPRQPSQLWIPVGNSLATLTLALHRYRASAVPSRLQLPLLQRGFVGHRDWLGQGFAELAAEFAAHPALDPLSWGSAYADDPWPRPLPADLPSATCVLLQQHYAMQGEEGPRSLTFVTRWSRSLVVLEDHAGALVLATTYVGATDKAGTTPLPEEGTGAQPALPAAAELPAPAQSPASAELEDAPVDVRWVLADRAFVSATTLQERLRTAASPAAMSGSGEDRVTTLLGLAAVYGDDLRLLTTLRWIARLTPGDWALRAAAIALAERRGYSLLLHELCAGETDPELAAELSALTSAEPIGTVGADPEPAA